MAGYGSFEKASSAPHQSNGDNSSEHEPLLSSSLPNNNKRSWWSKLIFHWFTPILHTGQEYKRLEFDDLHQIPFPETTYQIVETFERHWKFQLKQESPSLARALWKAFCYDYFVAGGLKALHDLLLFVGPLALKAMISFLRNPESETYQGLWIVCYVTISQISMSLCLRHYFYSCYLTGLRIRTALVVSIYNKALRISNANGRSLGEITNYMSIDAERLQDLTTYLHSIWSSPLQITLSLLLLFQQLGVSSLGGVSVILVMIPATKFVASFMGKLQKQLLHAKDARVEINAEVLASMKIVKLQAWEEAFRDTIQELRDIELSKLWDYQIWNSISRSLWTFTPFAVALSTFACYVLLGNKLDVASALTSLTLFDILRFPLFMFPQVINNIVEATVSLERIRGFLLCDEHEPVGIGDLGHIGIKLEGVTAKYDEDVCLSDINLNVQPGEFVCVVGGVGCGKSTLINTMLGEVTTIGSLAVRGKLAYFAQVPFIMNATVRENILFGSTEVNEELYQRALDVCALRHDLTLLPNADSTEIGEKGITLSGGQKARIALARAVCHQADVTLVDDALSAVDAHVAKKLFDDALTELLKPRFPGDKRCLILVTNALQYLNSPQVDRIVVVKEGRLVESGTYADLVGRQDSVFGQFLSVIRETGVQSINDSESFEVSCSPPVSRRRSSVKEIEEPVKPLKRLMVEETREKGHVDLNVYLSWAKAAGGVILVPVSVLGCFGMGEAVTFSSNWWLTYWSEHAKDNQFWFLGIYAVMNLVATLLGLFRMIIVMLFGYRASSQLFHEILNSVLHVPMSFFDTTPVGRLINRFSKDMSTIDDELLTTIRSYLATLFTVLSTIVVVSGVTPIFAVCLIPMILFYISEQRFFTVAYRELKRLDSVSRSPLFALLGESLDGVAVIRAFGAQTGLSNRLRRMLDTQQHAYYLTFTAQSWLAIRLELIGTLVITFACLLAVVEHVFAGPNATFAGLAGLSISYALSVTQALNWSVRMASDLEANMIAVERVKQYSQLESEGERHRALDDKLPGQWPSMGEVEFQKAKLRYRPDLPLVLRGLNLRIPAGSKVGVVGRTGSGKSTLIVALMRIVELVEGKILIDGTDIRELGLAKLRSGIAVIPQDPILFSGTIRTNLDPFHRYADDVLLETLEHVGLYRSNEIGESSHSLSSLSNARLDSLDDPVTEGGSNFSVGQRQLIVIARALLSGSKIVIMDECTASVDATTDAAIQKVFRTEFASSTCITVAHRLNTIMDSDFILVMDDGNAAEFGTPKGLLKMGGMFCELVKAAAQQ